MSGDASTASSKATFRRETWRDIERKRWEKRAKRCHANAGGGICGIVNPAPYNRRCDFETCCWRQWAKWGKA